MPRSNYDFYREVWPGGHAPEGWRDFLSAPEVRDLERADELVEPDEPCRACRGTGTRFRRPDEPCDRCHGEGVEL